MTEDITVGSEWIEIDAGSDSVICCVSGWGEIWEGITQPGRYSMGFPVGRNLQYRVDGKVWIRAARPVKDHVLFVINRN